MPLIRAFGRWLRRQTTDESSQFSRADGNQAPVAAMVRTWFVLLVAVLAIVPIVVTGSAYEGVRSLDRPKAIGERGHWVAAVAVAVLVGIVLVVIVTRPGG